jgi:hypothetical protein
MILKVHGNFKEDCANSFYDGFDYIEIKHTDTSDTSTLGEAVTNFIIPNPECKKEIALRRITLFKGLNILVRTVFVDYHYDVYLMSNEGKTIERIN